MRADRGRVPTRARDRAGDRGGRPRRSAPARPTTSPRSQRCAELVQVREDDLGQDACRASPCSSSESRTACAYGSSNASSAAPRSCRARSRRRTRSGVRLDRALGRERRRLRRGQPVGEVLLHPLHALEVVGRVQTQPARRARGLGAGRSGAPRRAEAPGLTPDRLLSSPMRSSPASMAVTIQHLDNYLTTRAVPRYFPPDSFYTGGEQQ